MAWKGGESEAKKVQLGGGAHRGNFGTRRGGFLAEKTLIVPA